jgi:hypothetical protein
MFGKVTEHIKFLNNTDLPINVGGFQNGTFEEVRVGPGEETVLYSTVGEWHLDSMFYNDEDSKIWKDRGLQKYHVVGKFRSNPCILGNHSWMEYDDGVFDCVYTELLTSEDGIRGHITFEARSATVKREARR